MLAMIFIEYSRIFIRFNHFFLVDNCRETLYSLWYSVSGMTMLWEDYRLEIKTQRDKVAVLGLVAIGIGAVAIRKARA